MRVQKGKRRPGTSRLRGILHAISEGFVPSATVRRLLTKGTDDPVRLQARLGLVASMKAIEATGEMRKGVTKN